MGIFITNEAVKENQKRKRNSQNKYVYEIDISSSVKIVRKFFWRDTSKHAIDIIKLIMRYVHPVKAKFRKLDRPLRGIGAIHFGYR